MEWISVKDRMPEDYQRVLCLFESGTMEVSFRASVKGFCYEGFKQTGKVTHWMPLPKKPKGTSMERITSNRPWAEAQKNLSNEMGYSHIWTRLNAIEDILGEDYDLDRLRELVEADRDGRCVVLSESGYSNKVGDKALNSVMNVALFYNDPVTRYIAEAVVEKRNRQYAEAALEG